MPGKPRPVITRAVMRTVGSHNRIVFDLYADDELIGWSAARPGSAIYSATCWQYGTGRHLDVTLSDAVTAAR